MTVQKNEGSQISTGSNTNISHGCGGYGVWFLWLLVNMIGMGIGWASGWQVSFVVPGTIATLVLGAVSGGILGLFQWTILRIVIPKSITWVVNSLLGWSLGFFLGAQLAAFLGLTEFAFGGVIGVVLGIVLGAAQWLIIRHRLNGAGWWIIVNALAWAASLIVYLPGVNAMGLLYGGVSGAITGLALVALRWNIFQSTAA